MASNFSKRVKGMKRGKNMAKKLHKYFALVFIAFILMVAGSAWIYWKTERGGQGGFSEALWAVAFTLIGQGEFANNPQTLVGRIVMFVLSVAGISLMGVVLTEVMSRLMQSNLRKMMGLNQCKYKGHTILCGWNGRAELVLRELLASGKQVSVICAAKPDVLKHYDAFFVAGQPSNEERLKQAGIMEAESAIVFAQRDPGLTVNDIDANTVLTALALETLRPEIYSVVELLDPANARHARRANVDDIVLCENILADIVAETATQVGISSFISDILSYSDDGSSIHAADIEAKWNGKTVGELFQHFLAQGDLPMGIMRPSSAANIEEWDHEINPAPETVITLPARVVFISNNTK